MSSDVSIRAYVRGIARAVMGTDDESNVQITTGGELITASGLPDRVELARQGVMYYTAPTISGLACSLNYPTTSAMLTLQNNNTTKSLAIVACGAVCYTGSASAGNFSLLVRQDVQNQLAVQTTGNIIMGTDGRMYSGQAISKSLVTLPAISASNNTAWLSVGNSVVTASTTGSFYGSNLWYECYGQFIVRPGGAFSLAVLGAPITTSFTGSIIFAELTLPLP